MKTIFVSSTFKDMQYERDAMRDLVLPRLNTHALAYGEKVDFCDLRWGVDTSGLSEEDASRKVIDVCIDEIDRSDQPMVVLLGERYGWIPDRGFVSETIQKRDMELEDLAASCTALEIEYGSFAKRKNTIFFFREITSKGLFNRVSPEYLAEDKEHEAKLNALKNRIKTLFGDRVVFYQMEWNRSRVSEESVKRFAELVSDRLERAIVPEWEARNSLSNMEKYFLAQWSYVERKAALFCAQEEFAHNVVTSLTKTNPLVIVQGDAGSGKSTLLSHLAITLRDSGWNVLPFIGGLNEECNDSVDIVWWTIRFLEDKLEGSTTESERVPRIPDPLQDDIEEMKARRDKLCERYLAQGNKLVIMVDAIDRLFPDNHRDEMAFIPGIRNENLGIIATCLPDIPTGTAEKMMLSSLTEDDRNRVLNEAARSFGKELSQDVQATILEAEDASNPLYLSLLVRRLTLMEKRDFYTIRSLGDDIRAINAVQRSIVSRCPRTLPEMSVYLLNAVAERINATLAQEVLRYVAISRYGLRASDLAALMPSLWDTADFSHLVSYLRDFFTKRDDGRYDFTHASIRQGLLDRETDAAALHRNVIAHFKKLPITDTVRAKEHLYHCMMADDKESFYDYFGYYTFVRNPARKRNKEELEAEANAVFSRMCTQGANTAEAIELFKRSDVCKGFPDSFSYYARGAMADFYATRGADWFCDYFDYMLKEKLYDMNLYEVVEGFLLGSLVFSSSRARDAARIYEKITSLRLTEYEDATSYVAKTVEGKRKCLIDYSNSMSRLQLAYFYSGNEPAARECRNRTRELIASFNKGEQDLEIWKADQNAQLTYASRLVSSGICNETVVAEFLMEQSFTKEEDLRVPVQDLCDSPEKATELAVARALLYFREDTGMLLYGKYLVIARAKTNWAQKSPDKEYGRKCAEDALSIIDTVLDCLHGLDTTIELSRQTGEPLPEEWMDDDTRMLCKIMFLHAGISAFLPLYYLEDKEAFEKMESHAQEALNIWTELQTGKYAPEAGLLISETCLVLGHLYKEQGNAEEASRLHGYGKKLLATYDADSVHLHQIANTAAFKEVIQS